MQTVEPLAATRIARDGAHAIFEVLRDWNVDLVFTCPGSTEAAVLDVSLEYAEMRLVLTTHESIAVAAADGFARVSGRPAVAYLHANVGLANGIAHLACALTTQSPVVILNGLKSTRMANRGGYTTSPFQMDHVRQYVRSARITMRSEAIAEDLTRALQAATTDPGGPVYLGLAQDLVEEARDVTVRQVAQYRFSSRRRPDPSALAAAARILESGETVTIVAGSEIARGDARRALLDLADRLDAPVLIEDRRTLASAGVTGDCESFAGTYAPDHPAIVSSDVVLFAGMASFMEFEPHPVSVLPARVKAIHLYNDPTEIAKLERADVGLVGDVTLALDDLLAAVDASSSSRRRAHRVSAVSAFHATHEERRNAARARYGEQPIHPAVLCYALHDVLPADCFIVGDAVTSNGYAM
jgi:benzoylformate decarboxylase